MFIFKKNENQNWPLALDYTIYETNKLWKLTRIEKSQ